MRSVEGIRIDFSLRREVFFVVIGSVLGAITMITPRVILEAGMGLPYYLTWVAFGHILGVYSSASAFAGIAIHMVTAVSIGIVIGIFLFKTRILIISKISNGLIYGLFTGFVVFVPFFIPVYQFVLAPEIAQTIGQMVPAMTQIDASRQLAKNFLQIIIGSFVMHLAFGVTTGTVSSFLSIKFGSRYRCPICDISFSRIDSYQKYVEFIHGTQPVQVKRILILGGGFAGVEALRQLQKEFQDDVGVDIILVSRDNFFLFTPMLPEVSSGMIETRNILTPIRGFCNRAKFYEADIESINLNEREVVISHTIGKQNRPIDHRKHQLNYDYLVIALGNETNYFDMKDLSAHAFTMKSIGDAIILRNHVINMLEQADIEHEDANLRKSLLTFVVVGGGFSGVETVGELNDFVHDSIKHYYHNIEEIDVRVILVNSGGRILPEVTEDLSQFALQKIQESGVEVCLNTRLLGFDSSTMKLNDGTVISTQTLVWAGGGKPLKLISCLECEHDKIGRIITNEYLEMQADHENVFALGDCANVMDPNTGKPYSPTAQHALRQARIMASNVAFAIRAKKSRRIKKRKFDYKTKGMMALIGRRNGVGILFGHKIQGFSAWAIWRFYYLSTLPTVEKKLRVMVDWFVDLFFKRDVTRLKMSQTDSTVLRSIVSDGRKAE